MDELQLRIGQRIRQRRQELGLTQQELAGQELTRGFISQLEKGIVMPSLKSLEIIAARLYRPVSYFLGDEDEAAAPSPAGLRLEWLKAAEQHLVAGDRDRARDLLARAREVASPPPTPRETAHLALVEGLIARHDGDPGRAADHLARAGEILRAAHDPALLARVTSSRAEVLLLELGRPAEALALLEEAARLLALHPSGEPYLSLAVRVLTGIALGQSGQSARAVQVLESALGQCSRMGWWIRPGEALLALGAAYEQQGRLDDAVQSLERGARWAEAFGQDRLAGAAYHRMASVARGRGRWEEAVALLGRAEEAYRRSGDKHLAASASLELARAMADCGQPEAALQRCRALLPDLGPGPQQAQALLLAARMLVELHRPEEARGMLEEAVRVSEAAGLTRELAAACSELGNLLRRTGDHARAGEYLARAVALYAAAQAG